MDDYLAIYESGRRGVMISRMVIAISFLASVAGYFIDITGAFAVPLIVFISSFAFVYICSENYSKIVVYDDRIEVYGMSDEPVNTIWFENIYQIGFLGGHTSAVNRYALTDLGTTQTKGLVILLKDGGREEFQNFDFDHLQEVYTIISGKMGRD